MNSAYGEGRNLEVERRYADGRGERLPALAADLVKRRVDVVVAFSQVAGRAALEATKTIPSSSSSLGQTRWSWFPASRLALSVTVRRT